jgi:hypothetical protein
VRDPGKESSEQLIEQLAWQISRWRLAQPAIFFLEVTKPLSFVASQGLLLCEPILGFFYGEPRIGDYANLLANRSNVEHLIARIEGDEQARGNVGKEKG